MRLCIYEDSSALRLEPITLTRPAFALWCGAERLFERHCRQFGADDVGFWVRPSLAELWKLEQPARPVNDADWLADGPTVWINGRWLAAPGMRIDSIAPHAGILNDRIAYLVLPAGAAPDEAKLDGWLNTWRGRLPERAADGTMLDYLWEVVEQNGEALRHDAGWFAAMHGVRPAPANIAIDGPAERFVPAASARVEPFVFA